MMKAALLDDRKVIRISGAAARDFLHTLLTTSVKTMTPGTGRYGALLTPQGKIIADFFLVEARESDGGGFLVDCPKGPDGDLLQRLNVYNLRNKIAIESVDTLSVMAAWDGDGTTGHGLVYRDPRLPALGLRALIPTESVKQAAADLGATLVDMADYEAHRIALGVPRGGVDFAYGDTFPHDADLDKLNGVDFKKGCFVGQEVVSRVEHRGTARNRIVPVAFEDHPALDGAPVMAGEKTVGSMGSSSGKIGLAMLRVDRVAEALDAGLPLVAGGVPLRLREGFADFISHSDGKAAG